MTKKEFLQLVQSPDSVELSHGRDLRDMVDKYPYFYQARLLWLKTLKMTDDVQTAPEIARTALYSHDHRWLYFYLYPEMRPEPAQSDKSRVEKFSGSYFDMLSAAEAEGGDARLSLKKIAEQLKASRAQMQVELPPVTEVEKADTRPVKVVQVPVPDYFPVTDNATDHEEKARVLIREKKYQEALEILKHLYLINPKKSIYFADQIRFLEKIIVNSNKTA
jgi:tetratricopeptide (TPR) repeat protein